MLSYYGERIAYVGNLVFWTKIPYAREITTMLLIHTSSLNNAHFYAVGSQEFYAK